MGKKSTTVKPTLGGSLMFPNDYLSAEDLRGQDASVTIETVRGEDLRIEGGGCERKFVMRFRGKRKKLVLNKTNATAIAAMHGKVADEWPGKRITLYPTTCPAFGDMVDCIRVRDQVPDPPQQQSPPPSPEPEPAEEADSVLN